MTLQEIRSKYLAFFESRGHVVLPSGNLVPEGDATTLFTSAGMQPMMPYLLGAKHPGGTRLVDSQKCFRSQDIEEVGDNRHSTFFEMLGNWSLGDYFKKEQLEFFFTFLTDKNIGIGLDPQRLYVTVFGGEGSIPKDEEAISIWKTLFNKVNIDAKEGERIFVYPSKKNWWSRSGVPANMPVGEPGGPDSEVFYRFDIEHDPKFGESCHPNCDCGRFLEIGNSVFMQYIKTEDGSLQELPQKNIDFGGGLVRIAASVRNDPDIFNTDIYVPLISLLENETGYKYSDTEYQSSFRVIADHLTASVFLIKDGVFPSNKAQGYVLRRLLRRAAVKLYFISGIESLTQLTKLVPQVVSIYQNIYFGIGDDTVISSVVNEEISKFTKTIDRGIKELNKHKTVDGKIAFDLYQSYGFPLEITAEILSQNGLSIDMDQFAAEFKKHQDLSRSTSAGMFKGGLADHSQTVTAYHTATHLLHAALRQILGEHVSQKGSNITSERLRFDFSHNEKLTDEQLHNIENLINQKIAEHIPVIKEVMPKEKALAAGALAFFGQKYPDLINVYSIGNFSKELCGGPHVTNTQELAKIKVVKQESLGASARRLYLQFAQDESKESLRQQKI